MHRGTCYPAAVDRLRTRGGAETLLSVLVVVSLGIGAIGACGGGNEGEDGGPDAGVTPASGLNVTVGRRCIDGVEEPYIVLTESAAACEAHAIFAHTGTAEATAAVARLDADVLAAQTLTSTVCQRGQGCGEQSITIRLDGWTNSTGATGGYVVDLPDGERTEGEFSAPWCNYDQIASDSQRLASDIAVVAVKILQGTTVTLFEDGAPTAERNAPVVQSRPALLRVFVSPRSGFVGRTIVARLTLTDALRSAPVVLEARQSISGASVENNLATTLNFDLPADLVTGGLSWKVALYEVSECITPGASIADVRAPRDDTVAPLNAESMGGSFRVVLVPFRYDADGSERLPVLTDSQIELFRKKMYAQYPIADLDLQIRNAVAYDEEVSSIDSWIRLLERILVIRDQDQPDPRVYYYGLISPTATESEYCGGGCVAGIASIPNSEIDLFDRASVGIGFEGAMAVDTFVHEIGHSLGRLHAPCAPGPIEGVDYNYPHGPAYNLARLGVVGYDVLERALVDADVYRDFMSYCEPSWISDYTYGALFEHIQAVNLPSFVVARPERNVRVAIVGQDEAGWGSRTTVYQPNNAPVIVRFESAMGELVETATAERVSLSHTDYAFYLIPDERPFGAVQIRLPNGLLLPL